MAPSKTLNPVTPQIPDDFFTFNTFKTVAGSAGAVWVVCLVIGFLTPQNLFNYYQWRYIAFGLSEILVFTMFLRSRKLKFDNCILALLNGFLVFANASGFNAISTSVALKEAMTNKQQNSSIIPFTKEIAWWPDATLVNTVKNQKQENNLIKRENDSLKNQIDILKFQDSMLLRLKSSIIDTIKTDPITKTTKVKTTNTNGQLNQIIPDNSVKDTSNNKTILTVASTLDYKVYDTVNYDGNVYYIIGRASRYGASTEDGRLLQIPMIYPSVAGVKKELQILLGVVNSNNVGL
jgi:hypothetical protein